MKPQDQETDVPADVKFEIRDFSAEEPTAEIEVSPEEADTIAAQIQGGANLGAHASATSEGTAQTTAQRAAAIKIGDKEFANQDEAFAYANELAQKELVNDAFRQGLEVAQQTVVGNLPPQQPTPDPDEKFDEEFYSNPKEYLKRVKLQVKEEVKAEITQQGEVKRRNDETWGKFYSDYPDLVKSQELVQFTLQQNWNNLAHIDTDKALKLLADKVRAKKKEWVTDLLPSTELKPVKMTASPGSSIEVTATTPTERELNFVDTFRNLKKKRAASRVRG